MADANDLAALGAELAKAAGDVEKVSKIRGQVLDLIGKMDKDDAKALFRNEAVQQIIEAASEEQAASGHHPPGTILPGVLGGQVIQGFTKISFTPQDLQERLTNGELVLVTFTPNETIEIKYNGQRQQLIADQDITCAKCFYDIYQEHKRALRVAAEHVAYLFRKSDKMSDWSAVTPEGARARGTGSHGHYLPGGGNISLDDREEAAGA